MSATHLAQGGLASEKLFYLSLHLHMKARSRCTCRRMPLVNWWKGLESGGCRCGCAAAAEGTAGCRPPPCTRTSWISASTCCNRAGCS